METMKTIFAYFNMKQAGTTNPYRAQTFEQHDKESKDQSMSLKGFMQFGQKMVNKSYNMPKAKYVEIHRKHSVNQKMNFGLFCNALIRIQKEQNAKVMEDCSRELKDAKQELKYYQMKALKKSEEPPLQPIIEIDQENDS